jgi:hypothetical protein
VELNVDAPAALGRLKTRLPWRVKLAAKLALARLPVPYTVWKRLALFEHGQMDDADYVLGVVNEHLAAAQRSPEGLVCLELGPGDTVASAIVLAALGAKQTLLVDAGPFASTDITAYRKVASSLRARGLDAPDLESVRTLDELMTACRAEYHAAGLSSLRELPTGSVDLIWSHAVLEHVHRDEVPATIQELRRLSRPDSVSSHHIDLLDHLADSINSLRFSDRLWESRMFRSSGFYTNRLRASDWLRAFADNGFTLDTSEIKQWPAPPLSPSRLAPTFRAKSNDDLRTFDISLVARPSR